ncbi:Glycosyltransferase family 61 protein [Rhynchospora pubera]|uniref:Glycosyltransferase family 61 protein n=1 Tax=Rhynchospora pubera TaxID=906938 RepID=A0AAV8ESE6_9POAL|nr:Glycosyltransferase family 61 protein [Rhynchospora pubera]
MKFIRKITYTITETWLGLGFLLGFFLVLALYLTGFPQFASTETYGSSTEMERFAPEEVGLTPPSQGGETKIPQEEPKKTEGPENIEEPKETEEIVPMNPICDFSDWRYDGCEMHGDARAVGHENNSIVYFIPPPSLIQRAEAQEWKIRSQSRKIVGIREVIVKSLNSSSPAAPECTIRKNVPALVFATNGLTFNIWHAFSDVLLPLFTTSRAFDGEVQFLITDYQDWFVRKYNKVFKALTNYEIIDLDNDREVRCYEHIVVGLRGHRELSIDPARAPRNYDTFQFRMFVRDAYSLPLWLDIPYKANDSLDKKPRMMIILRGGSRKFENADEIIAAAEKVGFEVIKSEPGFNEDMNDFAKKVDSCDVLLGAHGAGLTNMIFLRTNAILFQVVPWGNMNWACNIFYNDPAREMHLRVLEYNITAEESTLYEKYGKDSVVINDPEQLEKWGNASVAYWAEQNLKLDISRFTPVLEQAFQLVKE